MSFLMVLTTPLHGAFESNHCIRNIASYKTNKLSCKYADIDICEHTFDKPPENSANEKSDL